MHALPSGQSSAPRRRGLTLIELLVVITILAILLALLFPALSLMRGQGNLSACTANLRQIGVAAMAWSAENDGKIVPVYIPGEGNAASLRNWTGQLAPYFGRTSNEDFISAEEMPAYICPVNPERFGYGYNYAYLSWIMSSKQIEKWARYQSIKSPAETVMMVTNRNAKDDSGTFLSWRAYVRPPSVSIEDYAPAFIHPGKRANVLWVDGHVSLMTQAELMTDDTYWDRE